MKYFQTGKKMFFSLQSKSVVQGISLYIRSDYVDNRKLIPLFQYLGKTFIIGESLAITIITLFVSLPEKHWNSPFSISCGRFLICFLCSSALLNYFLVMKTAKRSVYCCAGELPMYSLAQNDWNFCKHCDCHVPPRTRHCHVCNTCVLKRDHHCIFTACCIGFHNQRYFISFALYSFLGTLYGLWTLGQYLTVQYTPFFSLGMYKYLLPYAAVSWIFGYMDFNILLLLIAFYMTFTSFAGGVYFFLFQVMLILKGQSNPEFVRGTKTYKTSVKDHLESVFGPYWFIGLIVPIPIFQSKKDGIHWQNTNTKFI